MVSTNLNSQPVHSKRNTKTFNHPQRFIEGWYWALPSHKLRRGKVKPVSLMGRELAVYRGTDGQVVAIDAYCPHMGAHLAEGKVEEDGLRCFFHNWKFDAEGDCIDIPCSGEAFPVKQKTWQTAEKYGMIWIWTGKTPEQPLPFVPELEGEECHSVFGSRFVKNCHPNVVMINAIDAHHFNTVHDFPVEIVFEKQELSENAVTFSNITRGGEDSLFLKLIRRFYKNAVTYNMCYWYGSTGTVTVGPDFLHFHIMFTLRLVEGGKAEGQTLLITKKRPGIHGWLFNRIVLLLTKLVGNYFAKGDTKIFQTIKFDLKTPTKADQSILQFIQHVEKQKAIAWGSWKEIQATWGDGEHNLRKRLEKEIND
ncbi:MAG: aromatic ring-hydroxylating dioxygenase subunit alpha [Cyanomargarita calcarea GSE-NOS-MK-12-04C]|jgi:phenylpropionate dioxygenase-like ring-hydroxylating dioxygenase large terminal subunit|uniref:Aromatic ring-hydroxylating dioxygenase subunit alpha n=1 Tax=Cyanomargarita calcarea GSE-NOS-MK-12-04C TaxID=2839659 RepID=A0A951UT63_9CYAN|nr:aromatic ring-hydroxylating dioxygenase subunit alpha [Cyanomargarita calcarea GSE-NOS-MK-12-04C]